MSLRLRLRAFFGPVFTPDELAERELAMTTLRDAFRAAKAAQQHAAELAYTHDRQVEFTKKAEGWRDELGWVRSALHGMVTGSTTRGVVMPTRDSIDQLGDALEGLSRLVREGLDDGTRERLADALLEHPGVRWVGDHEASRERKRAFLLEDLDAALEELSYLDLVHLVTGARA